MPPTPVPRRGFTLAVALIAGLVAIIIPATPAAGEPAGTGTDSEGGTAALRAQLDAAARGYLEAKTKLDASRKRQHQLAADLDTVQRRLAEQSAAVAALAGAAYRSGPLASVSALLDSGSTAAFVDRLLLLDAVAADHDRQVRELADTAEQVRQAKAAEDAEVVVQRQQLAAMAQRKQQAERALAAVGGQASNGPAGSTSALAKPAPRNPDGSWPSESCSLDDPTTSGCITPRTLHALNQAKAAGFTRYVSCYRSGGSGEHPKGRACDFAAQRTGFGGVATGGDRTYGNNLAGYFVRNASRLGVLYVIWYRQIWMASTGWRSYQGGGDPSSDHTNHVHLSMY